jgi:GT2 family glycosyltransferase
MSSETSFSIVVPTHNEGERLTQTVSRLMATGPDDYEVIVVDDFSTDNSIEQLRQSQPGVRVVRPPQRLGPPAAKNFGAQFAGGSCILWSDAHIDPQPGWPQTFAGLLADPLVGAVGPAVASQQNPASVGFGLRWKNAALDVEWLPRSGDEPHAVPIVSSLFMGMRREVFEQTGGFDPGLIRWGGGEMELSFRLWSLGYECRIAPRSRVSHLFRSRFPYRVSPAEILHNLIRVAMVHFEQDRLAAVIAALRDNPAFPKAMALVLEGDAWARRADVRARRVAADEAFFERFPSPGLVRRPTPVPLRTPDGWGQPKRDLIRA